jgi:hypothetical protein
LNPIEPRSWKNPGPVRSFLRASHWVVESEGVETAPHDAYAILIRKTACLDKSMAALARKIVSEHLGVKDEGGGK